MPINRLLKHSWGIVALALITACNSDFVIKQTAFILYDLFM